jgi:putative heme iron utilization protein
MSPEDHVLLKHLLTHQRVLSLAVLVENVPVIGLLPFVVTPDYAGALIHASGLAKHTAGLRAGALFSILIHSPDQPDADPLQLPRVTLQGEVQLLQKNTPEYHAGRDRYLTKFPDSAQTFALGDFNLYQLHFRDGRFVAGFGQAYNLTADTLRRLKSGFTA